MHRKVYYLTSNRCILNLINNCKSKQNLIFQRSFIQSPILYVKKISNQECVPSNTDSSMLQEIQPIPTIPMREVKMRDPFPALLPSEKEKLKFIRLNESIMASNTMNGLFQIYIENKPTFEYKQYLLTTKRLSELYKNGLISRDELHENTVFQSLAYDISKLMTQLEAHIVVNFYRNFLSLEIKTNSYLMQSFLQMMRHQVNLLNMKELMSLHFLLTKTDPCNLKSALDLALPKAIENCVKFHLPESFKFQEYSQLLHILILGEVDGISLLLRKFYKTILPELLLDKASKTFEFDLISLLGNLLNLLHKEEASFSEDDYRLASILAINCLSELSALELRGVSKDLVLMILNKLAKAYDMGHCQVAEHEQFHSSVIQKCVSGNWDLKSLCKVIDYQLRMNYVSEELVAFVVWKLNKSGDISPEVNFHALPLISAMSACDLGEDKTKSLVEALMKRFSMKIENLRVPWIEIALNLLCLDFYPKDLLEKILDEHYLRRYMKNRPETKEKVMLLRLDRILRSFEWNSNLEVPSHLLSSAREQIGPSPTPSLTPLLEEIVGEDRLLSSVITQRESLVDHLVILDEDNRPMVVDTNLKNSNAFPKSQFQGRRKIAVVEVPSTWVYNPAMKLRGQFRLEFKVLEKEGFEVLPIYETELEAMDPAEVASQIKMKIQQRGVKLN